MANTPQPINYQSTPSPNYPYLISPYTSQFPNQGQSLQFLQQYGQIPTLQPFNFNPFNPSNQQLVFSQPTIPQLQQNQPQINYNILPQFTPPALIGQKQPNLNVNLRPQDSYFPNQGQKLQFEQYYKTPEQYQNQAKQELISGEQKKDEKEKQPLNQQAWQYAMMFPFYWQRLGRHIYGLRHPEMFGENIYGNNDERAKRRGKAASVLGIIGHLGSGFLDAAKGVLEGIGEQEMQNFYNQELARKRREGILDINQPEQGQKILANNSLYGQGNLMFFEEGGQIYGSNQRKMPNYSKEQVEIEKLLTGEKIKGVQDEPYAKTQQLVNSELEDGEIVMDMQTGEISEVDGKTHEKGGEKFNLQNSKILTNANNYLPTKEDIKDFKKLGLNVSKKDTYSDVFRKYQKSIGITKLNEDQEKYFKILEKNQKVKHKTTGDVNEEFVSKHIEEIEKEKNALLGKAQAFFQTLYERQEAQKDEVPSDFDGENIYAEDGTVIPLIYKDGAWYTTSEDSNKAFKIWARKNGYKTMEQVSKYLNGGLSKEKAAKMLHEGIVHGKPITEKQRKYFAWIAHRQDGGEQQQEIQQQIAQLLQSGQQPEKIIEQLVRQGYDYETAQSIVENTMMQMQSTMQDGGEIKKYQDGNTTSEEKTVSTNLEDLDIESLKKIADVVGIDYKNLSKSELITKLKNNPDVKKTYNIKETSTTKNVLTGNPYTEFYGDEPLRQIGSKDELQSWYDDLSKNVPEFNKTFDKASFDSEKNLGKKAGMLQKWMAENQSQAVLDYFLKEGNPITAQGISEIYDRQGKSWIQGLGIKYKSNPADYTPEERIKIQKAYLETLPTEKDKNDFILRQFQDNKWAFRRPGLTTTEKKSELEVEPLKKEEEKLKPYTPIRTPFGGFGVFLGARPPYMWAFDRGLPPFNTIAPQEMSFAKESPERQLTEIARQQKAAQRMMPLGADYASNVANTQEIASRTSADAISEIENRNVFRKMQADQFNIQNNLQAQMFNIPQFTEYEKEVTARRAAKHAEDMSLRQRYYEMNQDALKEARQLQTIQAFAPNYVFNPFGQVYHNPNADVFPTPQGFPFNQEKQSNNQMDYWNDYMRLKALEAQQIRPS